MVLAFTEEQKTVINSLGLEVSRFKQIVQKIADDIQSALDAFFKLMETFVKATVKAVEVITDVFEEIWYCSENIRDYYGYTTGQRFKMVEQLSRLTHTDKRKMWNIVRPIYYRPRSNI